MWQKLVIVGVISLVVGLLTCWLLTRHFIKPSIDIVPIHDTIFRDSIQIKEKVKWRYRTEYDTIIRHSDDIYNHDSADVQVDTIHIPIDHYEYADSIVTDTSKVSWSVLYSGYHASIDTFQLDYTFSPRVPVEIKDNGWSQFVGIGISAGYGLGCMSPLRFEPFVGVTVTYGWGYHWSNHRKMK